MKVAESIGVTKADNRAAALAWTMRRIGLIALGVLLFAIAATALFFRSPPAPEYQGHSADFWLDFIFAQRTTRARQSKAVNAFQAMGNDALPLLLRKLEEPDKLRATIHILVFQHSPKILRRYIAKPKYELKRSAANIVLMNIDATSNAVPDLLEIARRTSGVTRDMAMGLLLDRVKREHSDYAGAFLPGLSDTNASARYVAVRLLTDVENRSSNVVSQMATLLNDPDDLVRVVAAYGVWKLSGDTNTTVPVLQEQLTKTKHVFITFSRNYSSAVADYRKLIIRDLFEIDARSPAVAEFFREQLRSPSADERRAACWELWSLGSQVCFLAEDVAPLQSDSDPSVREAAQNAVMEIAPRRVQGDPF